MRFTRTIALLLTSGFLLLVAACGGGDDDSSSSPTSSSGSSGGGDAAPTATSADAAGSGGSSGSGSSSSGDDVIGSVTVGDETWGIVASIQCAFTEAEGGVPGNTFKVTVVAIAGHAEDDESIEISIDFDPRDTGLALTVMGPGGDPGWRGNFPTVGVGETSISGEGTFDSTSSPGTSVPGSFDARC